MVDAFRNELRTLVRPGEGLETLPHVTRRSLDRSTFFDVTAYDLDSTNVDAVIQAQIDHFTQLGKEFEWKVFSFDTPPELLERLKVAGFEIGNPEALVIYDLQDGLGPFAGAYGCEVRRVEHLEQLADFRMVAESVFKKDYSLTVGQLTHAIKNRIKGHDAYVAYVEDLPVAVGRLYTAPGSAFAGLYGGGTLQSFRGQGYYRAVIAARARDAAAHGARYLQLDAMPTSLPILLRIGFVHVADTWPCTLAT